MLAPPALMCALPDDLLRALDAFLPISGLLVFKLVRCDKRHARVLGDCLTRRLDNLFASTARIDWPRTSGGNQQGLQIRVPRDDIAALFGPPE
jgi:hypothetical protein